MDEYFLSLEVDSASLFILDFVPCFQEHVQTGEKSLKLERENFRPSRSRNFGKIEVHETLKVLKKKKK